MSRAFAIFISPPILLIKPSQFSPIILNISGCFVLGLVPSTCNSPSLTASAIHLWSSLSDSVLQLSLQSLKCSSPLISLMMSSMSSSFNLPCFLNQSAWRHNCSIIVVCLVDLKFPLWHKFFSFTRVDNNWSCRQAASWLWWFDARCWFLLCLEVPCPLDNPLNTWVVLSPADTERGSLETILWSAPQLPYPQVQFWQDHAILRWWWMLLPPWVG